MVTRSRCAFCRSLVSSSMADWTLVSASATTVLDSPTARCSSQNAGVVYKHSTRFLKGLIHRSVSCRPNSSSAGQFQTTRAYWPDPEDARASLHRRDVGNYIVIIKWETMITGHCLSCLPEHLVDLVAFLNESVFQVY